MNIFWYVQSSLAVTNFYQRFIKVASLPAKVLLVSISSSVASSNSLLVAGVELPYRRGGAVAPTGGLVSRPPFFLATHALRRAPSGLHGWWLPAGARWRWNEQEESRVAGGLDLYPWASTAQHEIAAAAQRPKPNTTITCSGLQTPGPNTPRLPLRAAAASSPSGGGGSSSTLRRSNRQSKRRRRLLPCAHPAVGAVGLRRAGKGLRWFLVP